MTQPLQHGWGHVTRSSPLRHGRKVGGAASLSAQVEAILSGTNGFALDPVDLSTMWQDSAKTTPVTADGQSIGAIRTKWGNTQFDFIQATGTARPVRGSGKFIVPDGVDDYLGADGSFDTLRNVAGWFIAIRTDSAGPLNNNPLIGISTATATAQRTSISASTGRSRVQQRRLDADTLNDNFGVAGAYGGATFSLEQDLASTGNAQTRIDNVNFESFTLAGTVGNSENTASPRMRLFCALNNAFFQTRPVGRIVVLPFVPSAGQRATVQSWLTEV